MQFVLIFVAVTVVWFLIGEVATRLSGYILGTKISRMMGYSWDETGQYIDKKAKQKSKDTEITKYDIWCNSLLWPHSIYRAFIGYTRIKRDILSQDASETQPVIEEVSPDDCKRNQRQSG